MLTRDRNKAITLAMFGVIIGIGLITRWGGRLPQVLTEDGKSTSIEYFFPYGVYIGGGTWFDLENTARDGGFDSVEEYLENVTTSMEKGGFNTVWPNCLPMEVEEYDKVLSAWLKFAKKHHLRVIPQGGPFPGGSEEIYRAVTDWPELVKKEILPFYRELVPKYKDNAALLVWSIGEEPPAEERDLPIYKAIHTVTEEISKIDKNHPAIFLYHWPEGVEMGAKVVKPKALPSNIGVFMDAEGLETWSQNTIYYCVEIERRAKSARSIGVPLWVMGNSSEVDEYVDEKLVTDRRMQKPTEIKWQVWSALFHGAKGFFYFIYRDLDPAPIPNGEYIKGMVDSRGKPRDMYHAAVEVWREIQPITDIILRLEPESLDYNYPADPFSYDEEFEKYWAELPKVRWRSFTHRDEKTTYWMAVNFDLENNQKATPPENISNSIRLKDVLSGTTYTLDSLRNFSIAPGTGALLKVLSK